MATAQKELHNQSSNMADHAKDLAADAAAKAKEVGSTVAQKVGDASSYIGKKADDATSAVGSGMKSVAGAIRDKTPDNGMIGAAGSAVASTLEQGGRYLEEQGLSGVGNDLTNLIRRNPLPAVLIGIGVGYLVARALSPRS
jgi:hypothetical protein